MNSIAIIILHARNGLKLKKTQKTYLKNKKQKKYLNDQCNKQPNVCLFCAISAFDKPKETAKNSSQIHSPDSKKMVPKSFACQWISCRIWDVLD